MERIGSTPLSISMYSVENSPTMMHERGILEIIFCIRGSVRFSYAYEEFTLQAGEFISVDRDAYYLYRGKDCQCVSFVIDLNRYRDRYPYIRNTMFVCEGTSDGTTRYPVSSYNTLKGLLISLLKEITEQKRTDVIEKITDRIVTLFVTKFNIWFFHYGSQDVAPGIVERLDAISNYCYEHLSEKITLQNLADELDLTPGYISEIMRKYSVGFRTMVAYLRANESEYYLLNTDQNMTEISETCGFSDPKYYYAAFKRWYLCTPRQFRERYAREREAEVSSIPVENVKVLLDDLLIGHYREIFVDGSGLIESK